MTPRRPLRPHSRPRADTYVIQSPHHIGLPLFMGVMTSKTRGTAVAPHVGKQVALLAMPSGTGILYPGPQPRTPVQVQDFLPIHHSTTQRCSARNSLEHENTQTCQNLMSNSTDVINAYIGAQIGPSWTVHGVTAPYALSAYQYTTAPIVLGISAGAHQSTILGGCIAMLIGTK